MNLRLFPCIAAIALASPFAVNADAAGTTPAAESRPDGSPESTRDLVVTYPAGFFDQYHPDTAEDMVQRVPGFQIDDGADKRGFGGAAGNVLINDRRPSAKQDTPSAILGRIPAANVARIELIRGQVRDIDLQGHSVVVNVLLREDPPAAVRWEALLRHSSTGPWKPGVSISLADRWRGIDYNTGFSLAREANGEEGPEHVVAGDGSLLESRSDDFWETGYLFKANLNAARWLGKTFYQLNSHLQLKFNDERLNSRRAPQDGITPAHDEIFRNASHDPRYELGVDAERLLQPDLLGKAILLFSRNPYHIISSRRVLDPAGDQASQRRADKEEIATEGIARLEFDWAGWDGHAVQFNAEGAYNALDGSLLQTEDTGTGPVVIDVPGGNTRVEELRGDVLLQDNWSLGEVELEYGLGAETSTISQSGDASLERHFFFLKPRAVLIYSTGRQSQTRLRVEREVAQLDFGDFISATVFQDEDLALGNPNLRPDTTWVAELSQEQRFGPLGVIRLTLFHHWISDVVDLLPLTPEFEAPGNIGDARRWGAELEGTLPLAALGLAGGRLDIKARWQDSTVTDPVTGRARVLSAKGGFNGPPVVRFNRENEYAVQVSFRQDFRAARWAWGWNAGREAERPLYKVNELDVYDQELLIDAFVETTRWFGLKIRLEGTNLLNYDETRERTLYTGERVLSAVESRELRSRKPGRRVQITFSGSF
jgi:hypothetical protein